MNMRKAISVLGLIVMMFCMVACGSKDKQSFGLKDFEGLYYQTITEEMDGYNVTYTYGYQFNGDGTGIYYGQETVEITWNETEIHFSDNVYNYDMEPGKLTVHTDQGYDDVFEKLQGRFIKPNPYNVDVNNVSDGIYPASFISEDIKEADGKYTVSATLFTEDTYDIVDIGQMSVGDILLIDGRLIVITTIDTLESGLKDINGGIEEGGASLRPEEESNCYVYAGYNDIKTFTNQGRADIKVRDDVKLTDDSDPTESKEYSGTEAINQLKTLADNYSISEYCCRILVENGEITEVTRMFMP